MSFTSLINLQNCRVTRKINALLEKTQITLNPVKNYDPPAGEPGCMEVHISGCSTGDGTVTIDGTDVNGAALSESITFTGNGVEVGAEEFQTITAIVTLGFVGEAIVGDIEIRLITVTGQPIYWEKTIFEKMNCWCDMHRGGLTVIIPGGVITGITKIFCLHNPLKPLQENDLVYYDGQRYRIDFIEWCASKAKKIHHLELIVKKAKIDEA